MNYERPQLHEVQLIMPLTTLIIIYKGFEINAFIYHYTDFFVLFLVIFIPGSCEVSLNSFLVGGTASFGDTVNFTCTTIGSNTLAWSSEEYIGQNGQQLSLSPLNVGTTSSLNSYAVATVTNTYLENGQRVLESNLTIIIQGNIPSASVACSSIGTGESSMTSFILASN